MSNGSRPDARLEIGAFVLCAAAAVGSFIAGVVTDSVQWQGTLLGIAFAAAGVAMVSTANRLLRGGPYEEAREPLVPVAEEAAALNEDLERGRALSRRKWLRRSAAVAGGAVVVALAEPIRSLGPSPGKAPLRTAWGDGVRLVTVDGKPIAADEVAVDSLLTVFPEHHTGAADAQTVLVRVDPQMLRLPPERQGWTPEGFVAYSKVCTHAGCPVGLYQAESKQLLCPCHQSSFDVLRGAIPLSGPAAWPLPQLPLRIGDDGFLVATGDFNTPVGPGWWKQ